MLLPLVAAVALFRPVLFPSEPLAWEVRKGAAIYVAGKGVERVWLADRSVVGVWFDGRIRRDVEDVLWISPSLVSRWLGYLEAKEKWADGELERRWSSLRAELDGRLTLLARLAAYPRIVDPDFGIGSKADPAEVEDVRFLFTAGGFVPESGSSTVPSAMRLIAASPSMGAVVRGVPRSTLLRRSETRSWRDAEAVQWELLTPMGEFLAPEFSKPPAPVGYAMGGYHAAWYLLELPVPDGLRLQPGFELRVFSARKERVARFALVSGRG